MFIHDKLSVTITAVLLATASISWLASYYLMPLMMIGPSGMMAGMGVAAIVSSLSLPAVVLFEVVWVIGMAAMMFPAMIPMVLFYNRIKTKLEINPTLARIAGTPLFLGGYLVTYALLGVGAYLAVYAAFILSSTFPALVGFSFIAPSAVLVAAGVYQFTSLKNRCLSQCISPFGFFATRSRTGLTGAFRMGFSHGTFCVGCCWAFMLVMLAVGAMSIHIMAALAGVIALEKIVVKGSVWFNRIVGFALMSCGILVAFVPSVLATV
jgi:predicted metal-binding membrane protein